MIAETLGIDGVTGSYFTDVSSEDPFAASINGLAAAGLIKGMGDGTFQSEKLMTRQEYCVLLERVLCGLNLNYLHAGAGITPEELQGTEAMGFHTWAQESAAILEMADALYFSDAEADPTGAILREEAAAILCAVLRGAGVLN